VSYLQKTNHIGSSAKSSSQIQCPHNHTALQTRGPSKKDCEESVPEIIVQLICIECGSVLKPEANSVISVADGKISIPIDFLAHLHE